jgi:RNA polymerase sigma-70 factor (ECF subfamily)
MDCPLDDLIQRVRAGERAGYDEVVRVLYADVVGFVSVRLPLRSAVEELVQDTFVVAYERLATYECRGTFRSWIKGIARNLLLRHHEQRLRQHASEDAVELALARLALAATPLDEEADDARWRQREGRLATCLERLSPQARRVLHLRCVEAVPLARMAQRLKRTTAALANVLTRVKVGLRKCLDHGEPLAEHP